MITESLDAGKTPALQLLAVVHLVSVAPVQVAAPKYQLVLLPRLLELEGVSVVSELLSFTNK